MYDGGPVFLLTMDIITDIIPISNTSQYVIAILKRGINNILIFCQCLLLSPYKSIMAAKTAEHLTKNRQELVYLDLARVSVR